MEQTAKKGHGLGIAGFVLGILAVVFSFIPLMGWLMWILAILALVFGLVGCFGNKKSKSIAFIAVILAIAAVCVNRFYTAPKVTKALKSGLEECLKNVDQEKVNEAVQEIGDAVKEAAEETPAE